MNKLESITILRHTVFHLRLQYDLIGDNPEALRTFQIAHEQLLNRFFEENEDLIAISQYKAAKQDYEYFMRLVDLAYHYHKDKRQGAGPVFLDG
ncbi:MAG: hypothetical protein WCW53_00015 [Syntrophales bacterium]|jgi:hypothetical protein